MKCEVKFSEVKQALKAMTALRSLGKEADSENVCLLTVDGEEEGQPGDLIIESTYMGAYLKIIIPCKKWMRKGSVGVNTAMLSKCRIAATTTLDYKKGVLTVTTGTSDKEKPKAKSKGKKAKAKSITKYDLTTEQNVDKLMKDARPNIENTKLIARIPFMIWKQAAATIAFQTGLKEKEPLEVQVGVHKTKEGGRLEMAGIDNYGFAYFERSDEDLKLKNECQFVIQSILLSKVVSTLPESKYVVMGLTYRGKTPTSVRFKSENFDFFHPTIDQHYQDIEEKMELVRSEERNTSFVATQKNLVAALKNVLAFGKSNKDIIIKLDVEETVTMKASMGGNNANTTVKIENVEHEGQIAIFDNYLESFLKAAPSANLRFEQWGETFVRLEVLDMDKGRIEFLVARPV